MAAAWCGRVQKKGRADLMLAQVYMPTDNMTEDQWLEARRAGIGGSDAAAIAGLSKWKNANVSLSGQARTGT